MCLDEWEYIGEMMVECRTTKFTMCKFALGWLGFAEGMEVVAREFVELPSLLFSRIALFFG